MLSESIRRKVARQFLDEFFATRRDGTKVSFELWRNYNSMLNKDSQYHRQTARAFRPFPTCFVTGSTTPYIAVAETEDEAFEIMKLETPEDRFNSGCPEVEQYGKYWIVYD